MQLAEKLFARPWRGQPNNTERHRRRRSHHFVIKVFNIVVKFYEPPA